MRDIVAEKGFQISYMDDFSCLVSSTSAAKNCRALTAICKELFGRAAENSAEFAPEKTDLIHFSSKREPITEGITVETTSGATHIAPKTVIR